MLIQTAVDSRAQTITFTYLATEPAKYKATFAGPVIKQYRQARPADL